MDSMPTLDQMPPMPDGAVFQLQKIEKVTLPHPYCITPKHVQYADSMYLNEESISRAESKGAQCDICRREVKSGKRNKVLPFDEHENYITLFLAVPQNTNLNAIPQLHAYLYSIKQANLGIEGFAFPLLSKSKKG